MKTLRKYIIAPIVIVTVLECTTYGQGLDILISNVHAVDIVCPTASIRSSAIQALYNQHSVQLLSWEPLPLSQSDVEALLQLVLKVKQDSSIILPLRKQIRRQYIPPAHEKFVNSEIYRQLLRDVLSRVAHPSTIAEALRGAMTSPRSGLDINDYVVGAFGGDATRRVVRGLPVNHNEIATALVFSKAVSVRDVVNLVAEEKVSPGQVEGTVHQISHDDFITLMAYIVAEKSRTWFGTDEDVSSAIRHIDEVEIGAELPAADNATSVKNVAVELLKSKY